MAAGWFRQATILTLSFALFISARAGALAAPPAKKESGKRLPEKYRVKMPRVPVKAVTITGEVIDVWCYTSQVMGRGRGEEHKACAAACGHGGVPLGILEERTGNVYVAGKAMKPYTGCNELLLPYVARKVTVTGFLARRGGSQILRIHSVKPAKEN